MSKSQVQRPTRNPYETEYERILKTASSSHQGIDSAVPISGRGWSAYAFPDTVRDVETNAMQTVQTYLEGQFPDQQIEVQPHNNLRFDIRLDTETDISLYVDVKGTQAPHPRFYLSEGERLFSERHTEMYTLVVVYAIDIARRDHKLFVHHGAISSEQFKLQPVQWACASRTTI